MIDRASITNWCVAHPWEQKSFVEQDGTHSERISGEHGGEAGIARVLR